jgi:hypothetical protein
MLNSIRSNRDRCPFFLGGDARSHMELTVLQGVPAQNLDEAQMAIQERYLRFLSQGSEIVRGEIDTPTGPGYWIAFRHTEDGAPARTGWLVAPHPDGTQMLCVYMGIPDGMDVDAARREAVALVDAVAADALRNGASNGRVMRLRAVSSPRGSRMIENFTTIHREEGVSEWRHRDNGLSVLIAPTAVAPVASLGVVYRVGSRGRAARAHWCHPPARAPHVQGHRALQPRSRH